MSPLSLTFSHLCLPALCCPQELCRSLYHTFLLLVRFHLMGCLTTLGPIWSFCFWLLALQRARCLHILWFLISVAHVLIISSDQSSYPFSFNFPVWLRASCFSQSCSPKVINASTPGQASSYSLLSSPLLLCLEEYKSASWNTLLLFRPIPMKTQKCDRDAACTCKF